MNGRGDEDCEYDEPDRCARPRACIASLIIRKGHEEQSLPISNTNTHVVVAWLMPAMEVDLEKSATVAARTRVSPMVRSAHPSHASHSQLGSE